MRDQRRVRGIGWLAGINAEDFDEETMIVRTDGSGNPSSTAPTTSATYNASGALAITGANSPPIQAR